MPIGQVPWNKGKKMSDGMREKLRNLKMGNKNRLGKLHSEETRLKISASRTGKAMGVNHPHWKGGAWLRSSRHNVTRRERVRLAGGSHTNGDWELLKKQYNFTCPACGTPEPEIRLTKDHVIPVSKGGSSNIENIQPLCKRCNSKKHTESTDYKP